MMPRRRIVHKAAKIRADGAVSPICARKPRALNMKLATWSFSDSFVTCPRCRAIIDQGNIGEVSDG